MELLLVGNKFLVLVHDKSFTAQHLSHGYMYASIQEFNFARKAELTMSMLVITFIGVPLILCSLCAAGDNGTMEWSGMSLKVQVLCFGLLKDSTENM